jgi:hypothetical protein
MKERRRELVLFSGSSVMECIELKVSPLDPECDLRLNEGNVLSDFLLEELDSFLCSFVA